MNRSSRRRPSQHLLLVGRDSRRVGVPAHQRRDRRVQAGIGERVAHLGHVDPAHGAGTKVDPLQGRLAHRCRGGRRDVRAAAPAVAPGAGERGQRGHRGVGGGRAEMALCAHPEPEQRGPGGGELASDARDRLGLHAGDRRGPLHGKAGQRGQQLVVALRVGAAPVLVLEAGVDDRTHHPHGQRGVRSGQRAQVLVGHPRGAAAERVDHHDARPRPAGVEQLAPQVRSGGHRVPAPDDHVARVGPLLGIDLRREAVSHRGPHQTGGGADGPFEIGGPERVHHPRAHAVALDEALRSRVRVGQDRLATVLGRRLAQPLGHEVEGLVPAHAAKAALALRPFAHQRMQDSLVGVDPVEVVGHLPAQEAHGDRMVGIAGDPGCPAVLHRHVHGAGVGTVVGAGCADQAGGDVGMVRPGRATGPGDRAGPVPA